MHYKMCAHLLHIIIIFLGRAVSNFLNPFHFYWAHKNNQSNFQLAQFKSSFMKTVFAVHRVVIAGFRTRNDTLSGRRRAGKRRLWYAPKIKFAKWFRSVMWGKLKRRLQGACCCHYPVGALTSAGAIVISDISHRIHERHLSRNV